MDCVIILFARCISILEENIFSVRFPGIPKVVLSVWTPQHN